MAGYNYFLSKSSKKFSKLCSKLQKKKNGQPSVGQKEKRERRAGEMGLGGSSIREKHATNKSTNIIKSCAIVHAKLFLYERAAPNSYPCQRVSQWVIDSFHSCHDMIGDFVYPF